MNHLKFIKFFEDKAREHFLIRHAKDGRNSFFKMNNELEMQQSLMNDAAFPALVLKLYQGGFIGKVDFVKERALVSFEIRDHVGDQFDFDEVEVVRNRCKKIGSEIFAAVIGEIEENGNCGLFQSMDMEQIRYSFTGPINTNEYGWRLYFQFSSKADDVNGVDLDNIFIKS